MNETKHPAKFTDVILNHIARSIIGEFPTGRVRILDPFAGTGRVHFLPQWATRFETIGIEIEPEWADMHPNTWQGDALALPFKDNWFDAIVTSPTYGNRMADHHNARDASKRITYRHVLGRALHPNNSGQLQWGPKYRNFHERAWIEAVRVLRPGGIFLLNCSNHIRKGEEQKVTEWHVETLTGLGLEEEDWKRIDTPRMRRGQNHELRVGSESVVLLRKA